MKPKDYAKQIALASCVYYTVATFLILFIYRPPPPQAGGPQGPPPS